MNNYPVIWFILVAILYAGFFVLDGFDMGIGMLLPFLGKDEKSRRMIINSIGPHWDGNEVWLVVAGGATFAAFPQWYATLFSGFYLPLFLLLIALIFRGVAFEFRGKEDDPRWKSLWDWAACIGSFVVAILFGVAFSNILRGVPIDQNMQYVGGFFNLLNPFSIFGGIIFVLLFILNGVNYLVIRTADPIESKAKKLASQLWLPVSLAVLVYGLLVQVFAGEGGYLGWYSMIFFLASTVAIVVSGFSQKRGRTGWAFTWMSLSILLFTFGIFAWLFPNVMISSISSLNNLTIWNASSGVKTLQIMTVVAIFFVPLILIYQSWSYWLLRKKVTGEKESLHY
jgi:cytochrome bd ubiquinol oxidase subunit II